MDVSERISETLEVGESKRECVRRSILLVQDKWRVFAEHLEAAQKNLLEGFAELEARERDLELIRKSVSERSKELQLVRKAQDERLERARDEEKEFRAEQEKLMQELELKGEELNVMRENYAKEVKCREVKLMEQAKSVEGIFEKIDLEKKGIEEIKELIEEKLLQMDLKEKHLECQKKENEFYLNRIMKKQNEVNARERELNKRENSELNERENEPKEKLEEPVNELVSNKKKLIKEREMEIELKEHALESLREELEFKVKEADFIQELSDKRIKELDSREKQLDSVKKSKKDCFKEYLSKKEESKLEKEEKLIEKREMEIKLKEHALESLKKELEFKVKEADLIRELSDKRVKVLDSREKQLDSVKKFTQDCFKEYLSKKKECKLEKELLEKESKDVEQRKKELQDRIKEVELREKELDLIEKQCKDFLNARLNAGIIEDMVGSGGINVSNADLRFVVTMDGKGLQIFLNERSRDLDAMGEEVFRALHLSLDPAKLVLDAMEGFYPPHLKKGNMEFEASVVRRSCIVILEQLGKISPNIQPRVRDEAIKLAIEWKGKLMTADGLEVLGFLHLLASYDLASAFDAEKVVSLLASVAHFQQTPELCRRLGFADRARGIIHILLRNAHYIEAVSFIYTFELVDYYPPVPILKKYLEHVEETANCLFKKESKSEKVQKEAMYQKVAATRAVIRCIIHHKLESEYSPRILEERINQLLAQKASKRFTALESLHNPKRQQKVYVNQILSEGVSVSSNALPAAPNSSKSNMDPQPMTVILANMEGKELLFFLKNHIHELGSLCHYISCALQMSNDSAELVLDVIKGLNDSMQKEETEDEASSKWGSCILLLQQLLMLSPNIRAEIKEEARTIAVALKERIQAGTTYPVVVFGFLLFMDTYGMTTPFFDTDELFSSCESGSHDRIVVKLCQALGISEETSESSLHQSLVEVLGRSLENLVVNNRIDSTSMVPGLDAKSFSDVVDAKGRQHNSMAGEIPAFICKASDPASLVLDALLSCYNSMHGECSRFKLVAKSFFQLLQQLTRVSPEIKPNIREKATKFALDWKAKWPLHLTGRLSSWEALGFLQLIATYKVSSSFNADELHSLQEAAYQPKEAIPLFRSLDLMDKIPSFISNLIKNKQLVLALTFIYKFKHVDKFPPVPLLKNHILHLKKLDNKRCAENRNTAEVQDKVIFSEICDLKAVIRCIERYGLETELPSDELRNQISKLRRQRMCLKILTTRWSSRAEQQQQAAANEVALTPSGQVQQEGMKKRSASTAGIVHITQPLLTKCARLSQ